MDKKVIGTVVDIKKQYFFPHASLPKKMSSFDSIIFPYVITVRYTVNGVDYHKKRWVDTRDDVPIMGERVTVLYREDKPEKARVLRATETKDDGKFPPLVFFFIFLVFAITFVVFLFISVDYQRKSEISYDELVYMELTVEEVRKSRDPDLGDTYWIDVRENDKPIEINNLLIKPTVREGLDDLNPKDKIYCYLIEDSSRFEAVEIKGDEIILSLEQYRDIYRKNSMIGFVVSPITIALTAGLAIKCLVDHIKKKKESKGE